MLQAAQWLLLVVEGTLPRIARSVASGVVGAAFLLALSAPSTIWDGGSLGEGTAELPVEAKSHHFGHHARGRTHNLYMYPTFIYV